MERLYSLFYHFAALLARTKRCLLYPFALVERGYLSKSLDTSISIDSQGPKITILIPVRDQINEHLFNFLTKIESQTLPKGEIIILVVDYGSSPEGKAHLEKLSKQFTFKLLHAGKTSRWSRARALNLGIKATTSPLVLLGHKDILLEENYLEVALDEFRKNPVQVLVSKMLDLPQDYKSISHVSSKELREIGNPRLGWEFHPSVAIVPTKILKQIRGLDERFELWGHEDLDLFRRLKSLGLKENNISSRSVYFHQYHDKYAGVSDEPNLSRVISKNWLYYLSDPFIIRNWKGWGDKKTFVSPRA